ncbi:hypothetical protein N5W20_04700 [Candidatus Kirkpatrickella diaphorinae]|uniref:Uncharacterized protein n=1 Tax=Candidatus Kirkpatrickella diaphorinae TaxID=2984322 RepID=A0ABY6GN02_9PROT|nr:hypothetical protein [Candidatus Kirkpatrickella diaphorinae]UYH52156.1 hypothetical protein N5W20_04700 [Candidatus Kirkpatrickella diaphorinae]
MAQGKPIYRGMMISQNRQGALLLMISLIAGTLGGLLGLRETGVSGGAMRAVHGVLLEFYVITPAFLGGLGRLLLPSALGRPEARFHPIDWVAVALLMLGLGCALASLGGFAPGMAYSLIAWSLSMALLSTNTVIFILENRRTGFADMSCLAWTELATSAGLIAITPVIAMMALKILPASNASLSLFVGVFALPLQAIAMSATIGMMSSAFFSDDHAPSIPLIVLISFIGLAVPVIWLKFFTIGVLQAGHVALAWLSVPSIAVIAIFIRQLWRPVRQDIAAIIWSIGAMLLLVADGVLQWRSPTGMAEHAITLFAAICALFGSFYAWQRAQSMIVVSPLFGILHFSTFFSGVFLSMAPWPAAQSIGHLMMSLCLAFVGVLLLRLVLCTRDGQATSPHIEMSHRV